MFNGGCTSDQVKPNHILAYRPTPNHENNYHGDILEKSFKDVVIDNIYKKMNKQITPTPDILLVGDFNFRRAQWNAGIGEVRPDNRCNNSSLQRLIGSWFWKWSIPQSSNDYHNSFIITHWL